VLNGLGRFGCTPGVMHSHGTNGSCVEEQNAAALDFNNELKTLVDQFNNRFSANSKFIMIHTAPKAFDTHGNKFGFAYCSIHISKLKAMYCLWLRCMQYNNTMYILTLILIPK